MTIKLVKENMKHRPMRSLLSALLIGVPVTLILCLVGLSHGMVDENNRRTQGIGADIIVRPTGSSMLSLSGGMDERVVGFLAKQPHVAMAMGVVNQAVEGITLGATGIDLDQFNRMSGGFNYLEGGPFRGADDVIVDQYYAEQKHLHVGSTVNILNRDWRVSGIIESGKLTRIALPIRILQERTSNLGKVSQIYLKLDNSSLTNDVVKDLKGLLKDYPIYSVADWTSLFNVNNIPGLQPFTVVIMVIGIVIGFLVVYLSMYMAVLQRTREIGILKSLGASSAFILGIILTEALMLGLGGTLLGIGMSYGAYWLIRTLVPASFPLVIVYSWWPIACGITLAGAGLGALYPGFSAARHDPIEALAYE